MQFNLQLTYLENKTSYGIYLSYYISNVYSTRDFIMFSSIQVTFFF